MDIVETSIDNIFKKIDALYSSFKSVIIITDSNVYDIYLKDKDYKIIVFDAGEDNKNLKTVEYIYSKLLEFGANRNTILIGFGGGIVTDITGYVASTYNRGLEFYFVSTTLLGMVDAAIGGKNGVNFNNYKNFIGTFNLPLALYYSIDFINSLPNKELEAAFGEILKYAIGFDRELFDYLYNTNYNDVIINDESLKYVINRCINIKENIIIEDFEENGERKKLNLGHTIAHAIEKSTHSFVHGKAVGIGLFTIAYYSALKNKISFEELIKILNILDNYYLTIPIQKYKEVLKCIEYIVNDKKSVDINNIDIVYINGIGNCNIDKINKNEFIKDVDSMFLIS